MGDDEWLPPLPGREGNRVTHVDNKVLVEVGNANIELDFADALALASQIICICEVHERVRR